MIGFGEVALLGGVYFSPNSDQEASETGERRLANSRVNQQAVTGALDTTSSVRSQVALSRQAPVRRTFGVYQIWCKQAIQTASGR